ncbi:peptidoglycan editing factor PgeF [Propionivibrio limicola]|uniref:peptidoglycan editing factor PgeF n=1 Tax=Propionivibrio limicola TaxID=167645 RepID=UPI0012927F1B|nr:peptidoglycan editing factor PgeF [Propionivibrio limicola]
MSTNAPAPDALIIPAWPAPSGVRSLITTRRGGVSTGPYASLNLGDHVGDDPRAVAANRVLVAEAVGAPPVWLNQVHGTSVVDAAIHLAAVVPPEADAAWARAPSVVCTAMTADCLPVLFCDTAGTVVAAAHAGWRGLLAGILEETIAAMRVPAGEILAYLGPAIGPDAFEVGSEVRAAFMARTPEAAVAFRPSSEGGDGKWLADIYLLARQRLAQQGVRKVFGGDFCTVTDRERFFSYRRDGQTGRMASMIWLDRD